MSISKHIKEHIALGLDPGGKSPNLNRIVKALRRTQYAGYGKHVFAVGNVTGTGAAVITMSDTSGIVVGMRVAGEGIDPGVNATVQSIVPNTSVTISANLLAGGGAATVLRFSDPNDVATVAIQKTPAGICPIGAAPVTVDTGTGVISQTGHGYRPNELIFFNGTSVGNLTAGDPYYVSITSFTANSYRISATRDGAALALSGTFTSVIASCPRLLDLDDITIEKEAPAYWFAGTTVDGFTTQRAGRANSDTPRQVLSFATDSRRIAARVVGTGSVYGSLTVNGVPVGGSASANAATGAMTNNRLQWITWTLPRSLPRGMHEITVMLTGHVGIAHLAIERGSRVRRLQRQGKFRMALMADSFAQQPSFGGVLSWGDEIAVRLGASDCWVDYYGGSGYTNSNGGSNQYIQRVPFITANNPDLILIWGGLNDPAAILESAYATALADTTAFFAALRAAAPNQVIVACAPAMPGNAYKPVQARAIKNGLATIRGPWVFIDNMQGGWVTSSGTSFGLNDSVILSGQAIGGNIYGLPSTSNTSELIGRLVTGPGVPANTFVSGYVRQNLLIISQGATDPGSAQNYTYFGQGAWNTGSGNLGSPTGFGNNDFYTQPDGTHPSQANIEYLSDQINSHLFSALMSMAA